MAELRTIARPYAKAAFQVGLEQNSLAEWGQALATLGQLAQVDKVSQLLDAPSLTAAQKTEKLLSLCGDSFPKSVINFVGSLSAYGRLSLLPEIYRLFDELKAEHESNVNVVVKTAYPLDDATENKIASALKNKLNREIAVEVAVDESLLGGAIIKVGDSVIDGSIKGRLAKLATAMNS